MNPAPRQLIDPLSGDPPYLRASPVCGLRDFLVPARVEHVENLSPSAPQRLDHGSDAVDDLLLQLPATKDRTFGRVLGGPPFVVELVAQPVSGSPVLLAPRHLPGGRLLQDLFL